MSEIREKANLSGGRYKQNQRFEEMRRLQDTLAIEKKDWFHRKEALEAEERDTKLRLAKDLVRIVCLSNLNLVAQCGHFRIFLSFIFYVESTSSKNAVFAIFRGSEFS